MDSESQARAKAARLPGGERILAHLQSERVRRTLAWAAEAGEVPLGSVAAELIAKFPDETRDLQVRQLVGLAIRSVLSQAGFEVSVARKRIPNAEPFLLGATYRRRPAAPPAHSPGLVERLVSSLDEAEASEAFELLRKRLRR